jgi:hypothetical protein
MTTPTTDIRPKWLRRRDRKMWAALCTCIINAKLGETENQWQRLPGPVWCEIHRQGGTTHHFHHGANLTVTR